MSTLTEDTPAQAQAPDRSESLLVYFAVGVFLGTLFIKSEVASWFRIQEMFRFEAVHMYGVIGLAVGVAALSVALMKWLGVRTVRGEPIGFPRIQDAGVHPNHILGGTAFGLGWGLIGACPGPLFALIGSGIAVMGVGLLAALAGAWSYGLLKGHLPH